MIHDPQRGAIAILMAFALLVALSATAFGVSRNVIREGSISGDALLTSQAASAADSGVDWFLALCAGGGLPPDCPEVEVCVPMADDRFRESFTLKALRLGSLPGPGGGTEAPPEVLWQIQVRGRAWVLQKGRPVVFFQCVREIKLAFPATDPGSAGQCGRLLGWSQANPIH